MGIDEDSVQEKLLPKNIQENLKGESESEMKNKNSSGKMDSIKVTNEKESEKLLDGEAEEGDLRLHDAVYDPDNIEEIETLVAEEPRLVFERDNEGRTPLHTLSLAGDEQAFEIAKILLGVNESDDDDSSLISIDRPEVLNLQDANNCTVLHYACRGRQVDLVKALLKWGSDPGIQNAEGDVALHCVAEGNTDNAVEVAKLLMAHDTKKTFINMVNNRDMTPLLVAISKKAVNMVNFLLKGENKCGLSVKNSIGRTAIFFACSAIGESENACQIVKSLLRACTKAQLNQTDNNGRTCLHLAAIKRLPKIAKILVEDENMDVVKSDDNLRTALHYACEDGCYTKGYQCVEVLIKREFEKYQEQVNYLFKMEDIKKNTAFMYATVNCPAETMKKYTDLCPKPQYWLSSMYMTLLYKNSPMALKPLMDKAFSEEQNETQEEEDGIKTDFGAITGYTDPVDVMPQQETKYLKQALWWNYDSQRCILLHPLVQFFMAKKWQKLKWIIGFWILWQLIWLVAYTSVGINFYTGVGTGNKSSHENDAGFGTDTKAKWLAFVGSFVMFVYLIGSVVNECFEVFTVGTAYVLSLTNILQLAQCVLGFIAIFPVYAGYDKPDTWMKYTTAAGLLLAYVLSMRDIGKLHSKIGLIVEVLKQVLIQIVQVLICCSPLIAGFTLAFIIVFDDEESLNSNFPGPLVKILVMMTGEFEYNDTFKDEEGNKQYLLNDWTRVARLMLFLAFLISVPVGFFNLLTGFALDKVMELRERAEVSRMAKQLEHIYFIESILLSLRPLRKLFSHDALVSFMRKLNVTSKYFNTETGPILKFETFITETIRKQERNFKKNSSGFKNKMCNNTLACCNPELHSEVIEEIYALAAPSS